MQDVLGIPLRMPPFYYFFKVSHPGPLPTALDTSRQFTLAEVCTFGSKLGKYLGVPTHHFGQHHDVSIPIRLNQNPFKMSDRLCHATAGTRQMIRFKYSFRRAMVRVFLPTAPVKRTHPRPTLGIAAAAYIYTYTYTCIVLRGAGAVYAAATCTNHVPRCGADPDRWLS